MAEKRVWSGSDVWGKRRENTMHQEKCEQFCVIGIVRDWKWKRLKNKKMNSENQSGTI